MKAPRINEDDLLALVEGQLPPERAEIVRAALSADPVLLRTVEGMVRDRRALQREGQAIARGESAGLAQGLAARAIEAAERRALTTAAPVPRRRPRRTAMLAAAGIGLLVLGGWGAFMVHLANRSQSPPMPKPLAVDPREGVGWEVPGVTGTARATAANPASPSENDLVGPPAQIQELAAESDEAPPGVQPFDPTTRRVEAPLLAEWMAKAQADTPTIADVQAWQDGLRANAQSPGRQPDEISSVAAAELAMAGRLTVRVSGGARSLVSTRLQAMRTNEESTVGLVAVRTDEPALMAAADPGVAPGPGPLSGPATTPTPQQPEPPENMLLTLRISAGDRGVSDLAAMLEKVADELRELGAEVRFVTSSQPEPGTGSREALTASQVLWWSGPIPTWRSWRLVDIGVEVDRDEG